MPELDWETVEIDAMREEDFWDLLTSAAADVQEVALSVWNQSANLDVGCGFVWAQVAGRSGPLHCLHPARAATSSRDLPLR